MENNRNSGPYFGGILATIAFLDDNEDLRQLMTSLIRMELNWECLTFAGFSDFIAAEEFVLKTQVAILDINLGTPEVTGLDAYHWLQSKGYAGEICFLTGHAQSHPLVKLAQEKGAQVWAKPLDTEVLLEFLGRLGLEQAK